MGSFGEDLRMERMSRGIALEDITAVTKISMRHLQALEQERFRSLPGGILSKGIVRGYAKAVGLNQDAWLDRFLQVSDLAEKDPESGWTEFAANVGRSRIQRHDTLQNRLRWIGAMFLVLIVILAGYLTVRYLGLRLGWWQSLLPVNSFTAKILAFWSHIQALFE